MPEQPIELSREVEEACESLEIEALEYLQKRERASWGPWTNDRGNGPTATITSPRSNVSRPVASLSSPYPSLGNRAVAETKADARYDAITKQTLLDADFICFAKNSCIVEKATNLARLARAIIAQVREEHTPPGSWQQRAVPASVERIIAQQRQLNAELTDGR